MLDSLPVVGMLLPAVLRKPGLTESLRLFARKHACPAAQVAQSMFAALTRGESFQQAIRGAGPSLPVRIQDLLILGYERSALDLVLADMLKVYKAADEEEGVARRMGRMLEQWRRRPAGSLICAGCLEREIGKILRRAELEEAAEVILEQEEERFFHQWYVAFKPVHVIEPSHSLTYKSILKALHDAVEASRPLKPWNLKVILEAPKQFRLVGDTMDLTMLFR